MSREPGARLVFPDSLPAATPAPAPRKPGALVFADTPAAPSAAPAPQARALQFPTAAAAQAPSEWTPGPLQFPAPPPRAPEPAQRSAPAAAGARALTFPDPPRQAAPVPPTAAAGPRALSFPETPRPAARATPVAAPVFQQARHPLHESAMAAAKELAPATYQADEARLHPLVAELLPLTSQAAEDFGAKMLDQCREHAEQATAATLAHTELKVAEALKAALASTTAPLGLRGTIQHKLNGSPQEHKRRLESLRPKLADTLASIRRVLPEVREDGVRLALRLQALSAVQSVCGHSPDPVLERAVTRRLETLRMALSQATQVPARLTLLEATASEQMGQLDRMLTVTFSAIAAAR